MCTPVSYTHLDVYKRQEQEWSMASMIELMRAMSDDIKHSTNVKLESSFSKVKSDFDVVNSRFDINDEKFDKINSRFDVNDTKFDELKSDINPVNVRCESNFKELEQNIENMKEWRIYTGKCNINKKNEVTDDNGVNTGENNGDKMTKSNEEINNEVSDVIKMS